MTDIIQQFFLETVGRELCVFFCAMLPIIECRGAIPLGWGLGLPWWQTALFSLAGNLLPVPFILLFIRAILKWMRESRVKFFANTAAWLDRKIEKHKGTIEKYSYWGLVLFVAIPLPGTGAWTGTLAASILDLDFKKSCAACMGGVLLAGTIMLLISLGAFSGLRAMV